MKNKIAVISVLILVFTLIFSVGVMAKVNPNELLENAPTKDNYPEAGGIYLKNETIADFTGEKTKIRSRKVIKIFNSRGAKDYGEFKIRFNQSKENIKILEAKTIKPDGSIIRPKEDAINEITPPEAADASIYSDARIKVVSMSGVEPGSIVICEYIKTKNKYAISGEFWEYELLQLTDPIEEKKLVVKTPKEKKINYKVKNGDLAPEITEKKNAKVYTWAKKDVPAIIKENNMPSLINIAPFVQISTLNSWSEISTWYQSLIDDQYQVNNELKDKIKELTKDTKTKEDKMRAVYNYVTSEIRYIGLQFGESGYKPYSASETFKNRYGVCKEKATLLIAMLREIGVEAEPVLIRRGSGTIDLDVVSPALFNHLIVYLPKQDKYLDPTNSGTVYGVLPGDQGKNVLLPESNKLNKTPVSSAENNQVFIKQKVNLKKSGDAKIAYVEEHSGIYDYFYRRAYQKYTPQQRKKVMKQGISKGFANTEASGIQIMGIEDLNQSFKVSISNLQVGGYAKKMANLLSFRPLRYPISLKRLVAAKKRNYPLYLGFKRQIKRKIEIDLPADMQVNYLPDDINFKNKAGQLVVDYSHQGNKVLLDFKLILEQYQLAVSEYQDAKELLNKAGGVIQNQILLQ